MVKYSLGATMSMFRSVAATTIACFIGFTVATNPAHANVISNFTESHSTISQGQSVLLDLTLSVSPDSGDFNAMFTGGTVTINSGDGQSSAFSVASGLTSETFDATFAYLAAGAFNPDFVASVNYSEQYQQDVYQQTGGYYYSCGFLATCYQPTYGYVLETFTTNVTANPSGSLALTVDPPASVPEPSTLALMGAALAGFGRLRRIRRRTA